MRTSLTDYTMCCNLMIVTLLVDKVPICVEAKQKKEQTTKPTAGLCKETNNLRCTDSTENMDVEIYACENLHKSLNFEQARLTCSILGIVMLLSQHGIVTQTVTQSNAGSA